MTVDKAGQELYERARSQFPVFNKVLSHMAFMENAGGSQVSVPTWVCYWFLGAEGHPS